MRFPAVLLTAGILLGQGCARTPLDQMAESEIRVREQSTAASEAALTPSDIALFLKVIQHLPGQQPPEFVESEMIPLQGTHRLDQSVHQMRMSIRDAVTAERQVAEWEQQLPVKRTFVELGVDPHQFAQLMLNISCAWSAWQIRQERPLPEARQQLDTRIEQLMSQARQLPDSVDPIEEKELLNVLEELIVLSEFLRLLEQVPAENIDIVAQARSELRQILPESSLREEFSRYVDSQSRILRAGFESL